MAVGARHLAWHEMPGLIRRAREELVAPPDVLRKPRVVQRRVGREGFPGRPTPSPSSSSPESERRQQRHAVRRLADGCPLAGCRDSRCQNCRAGCLPEHRRVVYRECYHLARGCLCPTTTRLRSSVDRFSRSWEPASPSPGAALAAGAPLASAQSSSTNFRPARHAQDDWMDKMPGKHRLVFDTTTPAAIRRCAGLCEQLSDGQ